MNRVYSLETNREVKCILTGAVKISRIESNSKTICLNHNSYAKHHKHKHKKQVRFQPRSSAVSTALPAFAAERRAAGASPARRTPAVDRYYLLPAGRSAANPLPAVTAVHRCDGRTDGQTDRFTDRGPYITRAGSCSCSFSRPRSESWPHQGRTFSIYPCPVSF